MQPSLNSTFGAILIGTFTSLMLYGLTIHQTYRYLTLYWKDNMLLKSLVAALFIFDTFHSVLSMHICYHFLITNYFNPDGLLDGMWSVQLLVPTTTVIILLSQGFYARRIYRIDPRHVFVVVPATLFLLCATGFAIDATVEGFKLVTFTNWEHSVWLTSAGLGFILPTDIMLTSAFVIYLRRSRIGIRRTDSMLNVLVVYTINTGLLTSTMCFLCLIFALVNPKSLIYLALSMITTRCYVNAVLAVLNSRRSLQEYGQGFDDFGTFGMTSGTQTSQHWREPSPVIFHHSELTQSTGSTGASFMEEYRQWRS